MCDISYRQTKAGRNGRKQGGAKDREEGRDGITQRRRRKTQAATFISGNFMFFHQGQSIDPLPEPKGSHGYPRVSREISTLNRIFIFQLTKRPKR